MEQVVSSRRLRIVTKAALECVGDTSPTCKDSILRFYTHILHLLRCDNQPMELKSLKISADLEEEEVGETAAEVVCSVEAVDLTESDVNTRNLFEKIASCGELQLTDLTLKTIDISTIPSELFSRTLRRIETVNISSTQVRYTQLNQLFDDLDRKEGSKLKKIDLSQNNIIHLFQEKLLSFCQLDEVRLCNVFITDRTLTGIFSAVASCPQLNLRHLDLSDNNLSRVAVDSLGRAATRLEKLGLSRTKLKPDQLEGLLRQLAGPHSRLRSLDLSHSRLSSVLPQMLSNVICNLEEANLYNTRLSPDQARTLFSHINGAGPTHLKCLNVSGTDLSSLSLDSLQEAVMRLEQLEMTSCRLNLHHVLALDLRDFAQNYLK